MNFTIDRTLRLTHDENNGLSAAVFGKTLRAYVAQGGGFVLKDIPAWPLKLNGMTQEGFSSLRLENGSPSGGGVQLVVKMSFGDLFQFLCRCKHSIIDLSAYTGPATKKKIKPAFSGAAAKSGRGKKKERAPAAVV